MGNKSSNKNTNGHKKEGIDDIIDIKSIIKNINENRKNELIDFLLSNVSMTEEYQKSNNNLIKNESLFLLFISNFNELNDKDNINSHFFLASNDIIIVPTKNIYKKNEKYNKTHKSFSFPQFPQIPRIPFEISNMIIENDNDNYSIIKILNKNFNFEKYYEIPDNTFHIDYYEKFYINEKNEEELLCINISKKMINDKNSINFRSPIYIKKDDKLFLIGFINENDESYLFSKDELINIKNKLESFEFRLKLYQIKKLDFTEQNITNDEMDFIFQYDYANLENLDLKKKNLTNKGLKALENESLNHVKYLDISSNNITNYGLTYLNKLYGINELVLLNMDKLSDNYFLPLQSNIFVNSIKTFSCDKSKLTIRSINTNFNNFNLPNLTSLKIEDNTINIHLTLKILFQLDKICPKIKILDLSNSGLTDNGMLRLRKNISVLKNIESINIENCNITDYSKKYIEQIEKQNIKIIWSKKNLKTKNQKLCYRIILGGSIRPGKTNFIETFMGRSFCESPFSTITTEKYLFKNPKYEDKKCLVWDTANWNGRFGCLIRKFLYSADGVILLFDLSNKEDFDELPNCLEMITDYYDLEEFPVLLIGNKADLEIKVQKEEIDKLLKKNKFIGYFEVSCKYNSKVKESMNFIFDYIYEKDKEFPIEQKLINDKKKNKKKKK